MAAEPAYDLPRALTTPAQITAEALRVERACVTTYAALVAATTGSDRAWAVGTLSAGALSELSFGGPPLALCRACPPASHAAEDPGDACAPGPRRARG